VVGGALDGVAGQGIGMIDPDFGAAVACGVVVEE